MQWHPGSMPRAPARPLRHRYPERSGAPRRARRDKIKDKIKAVTTGKPRRWGWRQVLDIRPVGRYDLDWWRGARVVVGVVVPFAAGMLTGHLEYGAFAALGALPAGFVSFNGSGWDRVTAVALASAGMALSTFLAALSARYQLWAMVPIAAVAGYLAGVAVSLGQRLSSAAIQVPVAAQVAVSVPLAPGPAAVRGALVLAGGLFQAVLAIAWWAARPEGAERQGLARACRDLAAYAGGEARGLLTPPPPLPAQARAVAEAPNPLLSEAMRLALVDLLEQLERARASLTVLARYRAGTDADRVANLSRAAAGQLMQMATVLSAPRRHRRELAAELCRRAQDLSVPAGAPWRWAGEALLGQLRAAARMVARLDGAARRGRPSTGGRGGRADRLAASARTLRANAGTQTEAGRHGLRLGAVSLAAEVLVIGTRLPEGRWAVLTLLIVLKPDYSTTLLRSGQRALGTAVGAGLGIVAVEVGRLGHPYLLLATAVAVGAAYLLFDLSYALYSLFLTGFIVLLLNILGTPAVPSAQDRLLNTVLGASLAIVAFVLWPTWGGQSAREKFAALLGAQSRFLGDLLKVAAGQPGVERDQLWSLQLTARRARADAEAAAGRLRGEPERPGFAVGMADALAAAVRRLASSELALLALVEDGLWEKALVSLPNASHTLSTLSQAVQQNLEYLAGMLRQEQRPRDLASLRPIYLSLAAAVPGESALLQACDGVVDAVGTIASVLGAGSVGERQSAVTG